MLKRNAMFCFFGVVLALFCFSTNAFALGVPTPIAPGYPASQAGTLGVYYASCNPTFTWSPVENATWYQIWVNDGNGVRVILKWVKGGTSWTPSANSAFKPGMIYSWWVIAWNSTEKFGNWSERTSFTAGVEKHLSINANAFINRYDYAIGTYMDGGAGLMPMDDISENWGAPVTLPHGAVVTEICFYYWNSGAVSTGSSLRFYRSPTYNADAELLEAVNNGYTLDGFWWGCTSADVQIDNDNYSYFVEAVLPTTANRMTHVKITYWE